MRSKFYKNERAFFNMSAADRLIEAKNDLKELGYGIIIYDAYRPWFVTKMFWEGTPENLKHFVANPEKSGYHRFAKNLREHNNNREKYTKWLNQNRVYR